MPKPTPHPRLRHHIRRRASGNVVTYYSYDMRPEGKADIPLGTNHAAALVKWAELHHHRPRIAGRVAEAIEQWLARELPRYTVAETQRKYRQHADRLHKVFGAMAWEDVTLPHLRRYLDLRQGKVQANRELSVFSVIWGKARLWGMTALPWPAHGVKDWKNVERPRGIDVTPAMFDAIHAQADALLRDAMDIASATGMRVTDVRTVPLPPVAPDGTTTLRLKASKTAKRADITVAEGSVLHAVIARRRTNRNAMHLMLLTTPTGRQVSYRMLTDRFTAARAAAAAKATKTGQPELAQALQAMILRDCRKYASNLAPTLQDARLLLQHGDEATTSAFYRTAVAKLKTVR